MSSDAARPRQKRAEQTRSLIIDTAARKFAKHGFDGVSLNDLVLASGMSKGAFYFHFTSKEDVALAAFRAKQEELIRRLVADTEPAATVGEEIRNVLRLRAQLVRDDPSLRCVFRLGPELAVRSGPESDYASFQELGISSIAEFVERGVRSREFAARSDPLTTAHAIFAWIVGMDSLSLLESDGQDLEERTNEMLDLLMPALVAQPNVALVARNYRAPKSPRIGNASEGRRIR